MPLSVEERLSRRDKIAGLETHMQGMAEQLSIDDMTRHYFASGVYCREMTIPAGVVVVGKLHKTEHLAVLLSGRVRITTEEGSQELDAPQVMIAPPGVKRVAYAITNTRWLAIHSVGDERDLETIEERFIAKDFDDPALAHLQTDRIEA